MGGWPFTRDVVVASAEESVRAAARRMRDGGVSALAVVNGRNRPVGVLTDRDLVSGIVALGCDPSSTPVGDVMAADPPVVPQSAPLEVVLAHMRSQGCRQLPVVDAAGGLVGIVTLDDLLLLLFEESFRAGGVRGRDFPRDGSAGDPEDPASDADPARP